MFEKAQQYMSANAKAAAALEFVQDFLIKLGIKPLMHLLEIGTFPLKTYQNYEQSQQKFGTISENEVLS